MPRFHWLILLLGLVLEQCSSADHNCPMACRCDESTSQITCEGPLVVTLPDRLPSGFETLIFRNTSIRAIEKNSFRKMDRLITIEFISNPHLSTIEKMAFKGLKKLRLLHFDGCRELTQLEKNAFAGIANQMGLKIIFENTPIHRIDGMAFRNAQNIRELSISGQDLALSRHCFANIHQLDFLTISGVVLIEPEIFTNSTRFHIVHIKNSNFDIPPNTFSSLSHVSHLLIEHSTIASIAPDAFTGLSTIQIIELHKNRLGTISARAFANVENFGELKLVRNTIGELDTSESIFSKALKLRVEENTVECNCSLKWMTSIEEMSDENFCSISASSRSIRSFIKAKCQQKVRTSQQPISTSSIPSILGAFFLVLIRLF
ncbi:unnamed protein product [Caenorhabditis bovis]|uniref:Uncharacterized protein n=1 Tax=Caenorhabditis bovis TaxID=2654633 RepID=A0A8S1EST9_9PELO|nr:unnamed protein product [Caenorhabditis bovis]